MKNVFFIIFIILLSILFSACISDNEIHDDEKKYIFYQYDMNISSKGNFNILVPIVINNNFTLSSLNELISVSNGDAIFIISETKYGYALNITGSGNVNIKFEGNKFKKDLEIGSDHIPQIQLSMLNDTNKNGLMDESGFNIGDVHYFVHSDRGNVSISIYFLANYHDNKYDKELIIQIEGNLQKGWNLINGQKGIGKS